MLFQYINRCVEDNTGLARKEPSIITSCPVVLGFWYVHYEDDPVCCPGES